jgi:hypothetical protein
MIASSKPPLKPEDFPVQVGGEKINKQDGTPLQMRSVLPSPPRSQTG